MFGSRVADSMLGSRAADSIFGSRATDCLVALLGGSEPGSYIFVYDKTNKF